MTSTQEYYAQFMVERMAGELIERWTIAVANNQTNIIPEDIRSHFVNYARNGYPLPPATMVAIKNHAYNFLIESQRREREAEREVQREAARKEQQKLAEKQQRREAFIGTLWKIGGLIPLLREFSPQVKIKRARKEAEAKAEKQMKEEAERKERAKAESERKEKAREESERARKEAEASAERQRKEDEAQKLKAAAERRSRIELSKGHLAKFAHELSLKGFEVSGPKGVSHEYTVVGPQNQFLCFGLEPYGDGFLCRVADGTATTFKNREQLYRVCVNELGLWSQ
jgi:flagellar biosynthesis GTPase FlhF